MRRSLALTAVVLLAATACSSKSSTTTSPTTPAATSAAPSASESAVTAPITIAGTTTIEANADISTGGATPAITINADNDNGKFYFDPTFIKAAAGAKVTVHLANVGTAKHNFSITSLNINEDLDPGAKKDVTVTVPQTGNLVFFCEYHQVSSGMQGAFYVG